jgi:hypothetical protein
MGHYLWDLRSVVMGFQVTGNGREKRSQFWTCKVTGNGRKNCPKLKIAAVPGK